MLHQIARFHQVWALTQEADRATMEQALKEWPCDNIHVEYVGLPRFLHRMLRIQGGHQIYAYLWQIRAYFVARRLNKERSFDLFHHIVYANDWMASAIGALLPIPYVRGPGGGAHRTPKGMLSLYPWQNRLWERLRSAGQWIFRHDPLFIKGHRRASRLLVCNPEAMAALPQKCQEKAQFFAVNGISSEDLSLYEPKPTDAEQFRILSAGKLIPLKGFELAIKAFAEFSRKHPEATFTIVGDGPEYGHLVEVARNSQVDHAVIFEGWRPRSEVLELMASCDLFLFAGLRDGGGQVIVEAMSMGKPVVCLDIGGPAIHVSGDTGIKVAATTPETSVTELAAAVERLYAEPELRQEMGTTARTRVEEIYHWDRAGERISDIYRQILEPNETLSR